MGWRSCRCGKHTHRVFRQQKEESCLLASMLMALQRKGKLNAAGMKYRRLTKARVRNRPITEDEMRQASQRYGGKGYYRPGPTDVGAQVGDDMQAQLASMMVRRLGSEGTGTCLDNAARTLTRLGVQARHRKNLAWSSILKYVRKHVVIGAVRWTGGGGHAVLFERVRIKTVSEGSFWRRKRTVVPISICVCDPAGAAMLVALPEDGKRPIYRPRYGGTARFSSEIVVL